MMDSTSETGWCYTQTNATKISFRWTISNFSLRPEQTGQAVESSIFPENSETTWWCLHLYPQGLDEGSKNDISLFLELNECKLEEVLAKFKLSFVHPIKPIAATSESDIRVFSDVNKMWGYRNFLQNRPQLSELLMDDILTIECEIQIFDNSETISGRESAETRLELPRNRLLEDLENLLNNGKYADVIICVAGHEFAAHKNILASRSEVFQAMFEHDMEEKLTNRIDIPDMNSVTFREMLRFIYTGKVKNLQEVAKDLIVAADKYSLERLKVMCEQSLLENISTENAPEVLVLADTLNSAELKCRAMKFIARNVTSVIGTNGWKTLTDSHSDFVNEVLRTAFKEINSEPGEVPKKKFKQYHSNK